MKGAARAATRRAHPADEELLVRLEEEIFPEDPWTRAMIAEELASPFSCYVLALGPEGEALAYGGIKVVADAADIMTLGVVKAARGQGLGRFLLRELITVARHRGAEAIFLEVRRSNLAARTLYASAGFEEIGILRRYFRHPVEDAIDMRLSLHATS